MAITQNANRVRIESAAKSGTLGSQSGVLAKQIKFDTDMSTNNGDVTSGATFRRRHVVIRRGQSDEESQLIKGVESDGLTCNVFNAWDKAPASGDSYDIAYRLEDVQNIAGCNFETDSRQWVMTKRLIVGQGATTFGYLGMGHGQILRIQDRGSQSGFLVNTLGRFEIGTMKREVGDRGAILVFMNDASDETVWEIEGRVKLYEFDLVAARAPEGIRRLTVVVDSGAHVTWARGELHGVKAPFKKRVHRFKDINENDAITKLDLQNLGVWDGWLKSELDYSVIDALGLEPTNARVYILVEDN